RSADKGTALPSFRYAIIFQSPKADWQNYLPGPQGAAASRISHCPESTFIYHFRAGFASRKICSNTIGVLKSKPVPGDSLSRKLCIIENRINILVLGVLEGSFYAATAVLQCSFSRIARKGFF
ncbi:MAG: hypothetical protein P8184_20905, partial [Calditrichia bacterium]